MFINSVKDYITKNSYYFKDIQLKHLKVVHEFKGNTKVAALSINIDDLTVNAYDELVEAISECILNEVSKSTLGSWYNLYLITTIEPTYEELDDKVTARVRFCISNDN